MELHAARNHLPSYRKLRLKGGKMNSRRYTLRPLVQFIIGALALLAFAGAGVGEDKAPIVVVERQPPGACKNLGRVTGKSQGNPVNEDRAKQYALADARDLGATHFWHKSEYSGQRGSVAWIYYGVAYRCPDAPAPAPSPTIPGPSPPVPRDARPASPPAGSAGRAVPPRRRGLERSPSMACSTCSAASKHSSVVMACPPGR